MVKQKLILSQDKYGIDFGHRVDEALKEGWQVVPGSVGMTTIEIMPVGVIGYTSSDYRIKVVSAWCLVEKDSL